MSREIIVTPAEMQSAADHIDRLKDRYKETYEKLCKRITSLEASWQGKDNKEFIKKMEEFRVYFQKMEKLMEEYTAFLRKSAATYIENQDDIMKKAAALESSIK